MKSLIFALAMLPGASMAETMPFIEADAIMACGNELTVPSEISTCVELLRTVRDGAVNRHEELTALDIDAMDTALSRCWFDHQGPPTDWIEFNSCLTSIKANQNGYIVSGYIRANLPEGGDWRLMGHTLRECEDRALDSDAVNACINRTMSEACSAADKSPDFCPVQ